MTTLEDLAAVEFRFFKVFVDGNDKMYEKFIKDCPNELEGLDSVKEIVDSFKKNVIDKCKFIALVETTIPAINNITICRNFFREDENESKERLDFRKEWNFSFSADKPVFTHADGVVYNEGDDTLTNQFLLKMIQNKWIHRIKKVNSREYIKNLIDVTFEFLRNVMDVNLTGKDPDIPWDHLPCLPIWIKDDEYFHSFDLSYAVDDDGQTYLNLYNKDYQLVERHPYKKFPVLEMSRYA